MLFTCLVLLSCSDEGGGDLQAPDPPAQPPAPPAAPAPVAEVVVQAPTTSLAVGQSVQVTVTTRDSAGTELQGRTITWASTDPAVATVSESGLVAALAEGRAEIVATAEGVSGRLAIDVAAIQPPSAGVPSLREIATGLSFPLYVTAPPGDDRLFVVEKGGAIRIVAGGVLRDQPFLDLSGRVSTGAEQGLLGLAFPPDYASSGRFFVHYTDPAGDTRVSGFSVTADRDRADPSSETLVLTTNQPGPSHNGGQILFGPDGYLYIGLGDGGSHDGGDRGRGQSLADLLGSVLRIDVSSGSAYAVPPDNPFVGVDGARPEIWSYGLRNPWRFSFDRGTGDLYIADVGESRWEEVNRGAATDGAGRGANYGWSRMEGDDCLDEGCDRSGLTLPLVTYDHDTGCSITGGYVYRGAAIPSMQGQYFYGDFCQGWVRSVQAGDQPGEPVEWPALAPGENITSFGEDASGELYIVTLGGRLLKVVPQ
ncbi:MAG TPA: PQQ-dependent sugar dehydrogenase [Gemmatimonadales bacterium]|nr:PQQ-dependent sugar dehydrogenase [Gemmatimonadales bacterium]